MILWSVKRACRGFRGAETVGRGVFLASDAAGLSFEIVRDLLTRRRENNPRGGSVFGPLWARPARP